MPDVVGLICQYAHDWTELARCWHCMHARSKRQVIAARAREAVMIRLFEVAAQK